jgi:SAM-dependent methyltransferase
MHNRYYEISKINAEVAAGRHREVVGGFWDEIGLLQFNFLKEQGLTPHKTLLDIGCGSLRGGVHFVRYLDPGNYYGIDLNQSLLDAGYDIELNKARVQDRLPRKNLACVADFDFSVFDCNFDFVLAQSVFTHLPFNQIRECLQKLVSVTIPGAMFFFSFFESPENHPIGVRIIHKPGGITTYGSDDPYHYRVSDFEYACADLPWSIQYIGDWNHPRGQRMIALTRCNYPKEDIRTNCPESVRSLSIDEAKALPAGADHYRAYVGPPARFDFMSGTQFCLLFANGLRDSHRVLDFGCGSLRLGRLLIPFLRPRCYYGIEPNEWLIEDALRYELGNQIVTVKSPSFSHNSDFDCSIFSQTFHFIVAQSIVTHCSSSLAQALFESFAKVLEPNGLVLFSYIRKSDTEQSDHGTGWVYPACVAYSDEEIDEFLSKAGLVGTPLPWYHPAANWYAASKSVSRLPSAHEKLHLSGAVLFDSQFSESVD